MAYLTINGITIPVYRDGAKKTITRGGTTVGRALSGDASRSIRWRKRVYSFRTPVLSDADATALVGLIEGQGDAWDFEDAGASNAWSWSSRNAAATTVTAGAVRSTTYYKYGTAGLELTSLGDYVIFDLKGAMSAWTYLLWYYNASSGGWHHYAETSTGIYYLDGATAAQQTWMTTAYVTAGTPHLAAPSVAPSYLDDLCVVPYVMTADQVAAIYASGHALGALPELYCAGTAIQVAGAHVGTVTAEDPTPCVMAGTFDPGARVVHFTLEEA